MGSYTWFERTRMAIERWIANHLPCSIVYYAVVRVWAYATTGKYGGTEVDDLTVSAALSRWQAKKNERGA